MAGSISKHTRNCFCREKCLNCYFSLLSIELAWNSAHSPPPPYTDLSVTSDQMMKKCVKGISVSINWLKVHQHTVDRHFCMQRWPYWLLLFIEPSRYTKHFHTLVQLILISNTLEFELSFKALQIRKLRISDTYIICPVCVAQDPSPGLSDFNTLFPLPSAAKLPYIKKLNHAR